MARMPTGCFESTASTVAPQVGAYRVMKAILSMEVEPSDRDILETYLTNIKAGYKCMISYETETSGYEWFG